MRCVVRIIIVTVVFVFLLVYYVFTQASKSSVLSYDQNDIEARRILENSEPSQSRTSDNSVHQQNRQSMSMSVALVLIVSLISVALLITGIIIIAVTLDPTSNNSDEDFEEEEESELEIDSDYPSPSKQYYPPYSSLLTEL
ncbi:unnamed protein product [Caenorhabditis angaria]|uniref:Uncharacterized protein n=1 Tax=Caenorhabditis angaria TaxID=860376 RepID=A0A9P1IB19_9PELO|nr:unnamed protein product [Caenorhabditis angaria]